KSSLKNISQIDMVACIYKFIIGAISFENDFFPYLLKACGNTSVNLPIASDVTYGNTPFQYVVGMWGVIAINYDNDGDVSTISFEYED
ncbi:MAG: hypothetical protein K2I90_00475, partial [Odoribacter sp.]|nr:hypothetical protein [Odoribacter sp.]